ncbi:hypothetical protein J7F03_29440 [Streptomyces sp. ISL-43]|uniref:hypothetical protein n=1 Tax=Streptomyces sp. ISL-43 TaxID=2819183 RepID=UPI001BEA9C6C|nr:hypothetical protein [Streptomyces sp. ISL-43]MBT2451123.1 hypothetical protein [Streptomyces sp. ISL-43]
MRKASRSAALLILCATAAAAALTGCGGPAREGYVAVGAVGPGSERGAGANVAPQGGVEFQPLPQAAGGSSASSASSESPAGTSPGAPGSQPPGGTAATGRGGSGGPSAGAPGTASPGTASPGTPGGTPGTGPAPSAKPGTTAPSLPAATAAKLSVGAPTRSAAADRWCEKVTVSFTNTGGTAARSGTVSFATHIIGALGIDWATITSTQPLPAPIAGNTTKTQTYEVCVESWRVPLGMRIETRKVTATWS